MVSYPFRLSDGNAARYLKFFPNNVFLLSQAAAGEAAAGHFDAAFAYMERVPAEGRDFWPEYYRETARLSFLSRRAADDKTLSHLLVSEHNEHSVMIYQALNYIETSATPLKARDMDFNSPDESGRTPFMYLCSNPVSATALALAYKFAELGVNPAAKDGAGRDVFYYIDEERPAGAELKKFFTDLINK